MASVCRYSPRSPGYRHLTRVYFTGFFSCKSIKVLVQRKESQGGRNNQGIVTVRGIKRGVKCKRRALEVVRKVRFQLTYLGQIFFFEEVWFTANVMALHYAPRRTARLALIRYNDGQYKYMLCPRGLRIGNSLEIEPIYTRKGTLTVGTTRPLFFFPVGTVSHNIELKVGYGGQIARSAGTFTQLIFKSLIFIALKVPSKEIRLIQSRCVATLGEISNSLINNITIGKAGRNRWIGKRPRIRGSAMNPNDHPHGGGEGKCPVGRKYPATPWGKPTLGPKTRSYKKKSNEYILR